MTNEEVRSRALAADRICSDPAYQEAWEAIAKDLFQQWVAKPLEDVEGRERVRFQLDAMQKLKAKMGSFIAEGKIIEEHAKDQQN